MLCGMREEVPASRGSLYIGELSKPLPIVLQEAQGSVVRG
jgi:hypothetical protein